MKQLLLLLTVLSLSITSWSQNKYTISGHVKDGAGEDLIGSTIYIQELNTGTVTNVYGFYSITLPEGTYNLDYSYVGYETQSMTLNLKENHSINISLSETSETIEEVYEPFLIQQGFIMRTPRGREVTELAYQHLGKIKGGIQGGLF